MDNISNLAGRTIGKYQVVEHLGRGGMAEVYKAYQPNLDRYVALKLMHAFLVEDKDFISRFEREAKNVAALRHPNIVQVYDFDVADGMPFMVMEFIEGGTLKTHLENLAQRGESLPISEAVRIIHEIGEALSYAHKRSMIHRDVKPANVMLDSSGRVILTDFGIAKILTGPSHTATGATIGTPSYMSPEQGLGRPGDHRSDIYSLGVMLYQLATGQLPYDADTPLAVMLKHVNDPLPMPRSIKPGIPEGIERIILKSMAKSPDDRFQTVDDMLKHLNDMETATLLAVPAASMAGGVAASASTISASAASAGATAPGVTKVASHPAADTAPAAAARPALAGIPMWAVVVGVVTLIAVLGGGALFMSGAFGRAPTQTPPATVTERPADTAIPTATQPEVTGTPDLDATALVSIQQTNQALVLALATATPTPTPDLTQTALACTYGFELAGQTPDPARALFVNSRPTTVTISIRNTGTCAYPEGSLLVETTLTNTSPVSLTLPLIQPNETDTVDAAWQALTRAGTQVRIWELRLPDGVVVGQALTLTYRYVVAATAAPTVPPTPVAPAASPTSSVGKVSDFFPDFLSCDYSAGDYTCVVSISISGGQAPFTLFLDGSQRFADFQSAGVIPLIGRRCLPRPFTIQVLDNFGSNLTKSLFFDPVAEAAIFPGGGCTLP